MEKRDDNYFEEESVYGEEGELTFRGVAAFLRRAWLRMLIYLIAVLVLATAVFAGYKFFGKSDYSVSLKTEMSFKEISTGKNPDGSTFNMNDMRAVSYVRTAIEESGLRDKVLAADKDISNVRDSLSVQAVMPPEYVQRYNELVSGGMTSDAALNSLAQMTFYPTQFVVALSDYEELGFKTDDAKKFITVLVDSYREDFVKKHLTAPVLSDSTFDADAVSGYDYLDYLEMYSTKFSEVSSYLVKAGEDASGFTSSENGKSFSTLKSDLTILQTRLSALRTYVVENAVFSDLEGAKRSVKNRIDELTIEKTRIETLIAKTKEVLAEWKPSTAVRYPEGENIISTVTYPQEYNDMQVALASYVSELSRVEASLIENTAVYDALAAKTDTEVATGDKVTADAMLAGLRTDAKAFVATVDALAAEYMSVRAGENAVAIVSPAAYSRISPEFPTLLVYVAAVGIAVIAALIVTWAVGKHAKNKNANEAKKPLPAEDNE